MGLNKLHGKITLARLFIQHILSPVRSVHHSWLGSSALAYPYHSGADTLCILLFPNFIKE